MKNQVSYSQVVSSARAIMQVENFLDRCEELERIYHVQFGESDKFLLDVYFSMILNSVQFNLDVMRKQHCELAKKHYKLIKSQIYPNS